MKKHAGRTMVFVGLWAALAAAFSPVGTAQGFITTITTKGGRIFTIDRHTLYTATNVLDKEMTLVMQPEEKNALAHSSIQDGTEITHFYAKKITYHPSREDFTLEGDARIEQGDNRLSGPVRIEFIAAKNLMIIEGAPGHPAEYNYLLQDGQPVFSKAILFHFIFEMADGKRRLSTIQTIKGHEGSTIFPQEYARDKNLMRKLSSP